MDAYKDGPFQVTRLPGINGEWLDAHLSNAGNVCVSTSGYVEVDRVQLIAVLEALGEG